MRRADGNQNWKATVRLWHRRACSEAAETGLAAGYAAGNPAGGYRAGGFTGGADTGYGAAKNGFRAAKDAAAVDDEGYWSELEERVLRDADGANGTGSADGTGSVNGTGNESGCGGNGGVSGEEPGGGEKCATNFMTGHLNLNKHSLTEGTHESEKRLFFLNIKQVYPNFARPSALETEIWEEMLEPYTQGDILAGIKSTARARIPTLRPIRHGSGAICIRGRKRRRSRACRFRRKAI